MINGLRQRDRVILWALRRTDRAALTVRELIEVSEYDGQPVLWVSQFEESLRALEHFGLVQRFTVPGSKRTGPSRTLYGLTVAGWSTEFDDTPADLRVH